MQIKSVRYFEVSYAFMKLFSKTFEVLSKRGDVIQPKIGLKKGKFRYSELGIELLLNKSVFALT